MLISSLLKATLTAGAIVATTALAVSAAQLPAARAQAATPLTLAHLQNATYQVPDLLCGYTAVRLKDGLGDNNEVKAVFVRAVFGKLNQAKTEVAAVHLAYFTPELGWLQELVFVEARQSKLVQVAQYILDDDAKVKDLAIHDGQLTVITSHNPGADGQQADKLTKIALTDTARGCMLAVSEFSARQDGSLAPESGLSTYLAGVEERIGNCWKPSSPDVGEHVVVAFTICKAGNVENVCISNSSAVETAEQAAIQAVAQAAPFAPLPGGSATPLKVCLDLQASAKQ